MDNIPAMPGADALAAWLGHWPSFHDAEIHEPYLNRQGVSLLQVQTWRVTERVDDKGFPLLEKYVMVTFSLKQITTLTLEGFSHQNVIGGLSLEQVSDGWVMTLEPCYGTYLRPAG